MALASALTEAAFADHRQRDWTELEAIVARGHKGPSKRTFSPSDVARLPPLYRNVCNDLAAAEAARYSAPLVEYLRGLTAAAHAVLYGAAKSRSAGSVRRAWLVEFPRAIRRRKRAMLLAAALFFVPGLVGLVLTRIDPTFAFRVVPEEALRPLTDAYAKGLARSSGEDAMMAGFYVYNNVGIALRCFALGIFGGVGSALYLFYNGLTIGATLGYVWSQGAGANIGTFIIGHGSLELGAIVISGGAGLSLGWSIVAPGDLPRVVSLQRTAREILVIVAGAAVMLVMAAAIEGFWSASATPQEVKVFVGGAMFVALMLYLTLAGRSATAEERRR